MWVGLLLPFKKQFQDFATPSLQGELTHEGLTQHQGEADEHSVARYQINEQKKWEKRYRVESCT